MPQPITAVDLAIATPNTNYPAPYAALMQGREKRKLGNVFELSNFGVNLTHLAPGASSALCHAHSHQDEFIYVLAGQPTVVVGDRETEMSPGQCIGFKAGSGLAHQLINRTQATVTYLEIGDRSPEDQVTYPHDDLQAGLNEAGAWEFRHKDGTPY